MGICGKLFGKKPASTDTTRHTAINWKPAGFDTVQFYANQMLYGQQGYPQTAIILIFEGNASAVAAEDRRVKKWKKKYTPELGACTKFTDNMYALEYRFMDYTQDATILGFCRLFENSKVKNVVAYHLTPTMQQKILAIFRIKQGMTA